MKRFIVGNWKMHNTISQAETLIQEILAMHQVDSSVELAVAPPYVALHTVKKAPGCHPYTTSGPKHVGKRRRRIHRRNFASHAERAWLLLRDYRAFRTTASFWRMRSNH